MIGYIEGKVLSSDGKKITVLPKNQGIGYVINFNEALPEGSQITLHIYHHIIENDQSLWGFKMLTEKNFFELLKSVNKVGASKAYSLLGTLGTDDIKLAITTDSPQMLTKAPGIGKKMAEQIILSLKDKVGELPISHSNQSPSQQTTIDGHLFEEAVMALDSLGYKDSQVASLVKNCLERGATSSQDIIKQVLREM